MDIVAMTRMEEFAKKVLTMPPEAQDVFWRESMNSGLMTAEEAEGLQKYVALFHMFTDPRHYRMIREAALEMYMASMRKERKEP